MPSATRRTALFAAGSLFGSSDLSLAPPPLSPRFDAKTLSPLSTVGVPSRAGDLRYPDWLEGTWQVKNKLSRFSMPLGTAFVDSFTQATAQVDVMQQQELRYALRFVRVEGSPLEEPVSQDRRFNAIEETNAFLGEDGTVRKCTYERNPTFPHGHLLLEVEDAAEEDGGSGRSGRDATAVSTKIELNVLWAQWSVTSGGAFSTSELIRQRVARAPTAYEPGQDETAFVEILTRFERVKARSGQPPRVRVRNRIAQFLNLQGLGPDGEPAASVLPLGAGGGAASGQAVAARKSAEARTILADGRAISFFDYDWDMERVMIDGGSLGTGKIA